MSIRRRCAANIARILGIDIFAPRLSWKLLSDERGVRQSAYQVLVASSPSCWRRTRAICGTAARWRARSRFTWNTRARRCVAAIRVLEGPRVGSGRVAVPGANPPGGRWGFLRRKTGPGVGRRGLDARQRRTLPWLRKNIRLEAAPEGRGMSARWATTSSILTGRRWTIVLSPR